MSFGQPSMVSHGTNGQEQWIHTGNLSQIQRKVKDAVYFSKVCLLSKVPTYRVSVIVVLVFLNTVILRMLESLCRDVKTSFDTRSPAYQLQGLQPGTLKKPPSPCLQALCNWNATGTSYGNALHVKVGQELNLIDSHHQEKVNCAELCPIWVGCGESQLLLELEDKVTFNS